MNEQERPSARLGAVAGRDTTVGGITDALGADGPGLILLVLASFALIPGAAPVFATAMIVVAGSLLLGRDHLALPAALRARAVPRPSLDKAARRLALFERRVGAATGRHRVPPRLVGVLVIWNAILVILPIPLANGPPAIAAILLTLGLVERNARALAAGIAATVLATLFEGALVWVGVDLVRDLLR